MKFIDDSKKKLRWWNRNYFYAGTIIVVVVNILLFACLGSNWTSAFSPDHYYHWSDKFYFVPMLRVFLNSFEHLNWQHVLLNMLCFAIVGFYFERKTGSFGILGIVLLGAFVSSIATGTNDLSVGWSGFSGVIYFLYAYVVIDYFFSFQKYRHSKTNAIMGAIMLVGIYVMMCFCGGTTGFSFKWYPYDLMYNMGHYSGFLAGLIVGLFANIIKLSARKSYNCENKN